MIEYMGTGYGSTRFALITEQANATWKLKSFKIEEKRFTPKTSCGVIIPIDNKDYNSNTTPLFTASTASTTVSVPATPTPKRVVITGSIAAGAAPAQFGASLSFSTTVGKVYTIYLENVSLETTNLAPSYQNYTGYAVVNNPADAGDAGKMLANGSLGYTNCYKGYAITFVARATTTWLMLGGMVAAQDAGQAASVSVLLQKLRIVGSQPIRRTVQLLADKRYRYGFNGQEKLDEISGNGNTYDFGARLENVRIGRPFTPDPMGYKFPWQSSYVYADNNPILFIDVEGKYSKHYKEKNFKLASYDIQTINPITYRAINIASSIPVVGIWGVIGKWMTKIKDNSLDFGIGDAVDPILSVTGEMAAKDATKAGKMVLETNRATFSFIASFDNAEYAPLVVDQIMIKMLEDKGYGKRYGVYENGTADGFSFSTDYLNKVYKESKEDVQKNPEKYKEKGLWGTEIGTTPEEYKAVEEAKKRIDNVLVQTRKEAQKVYDETKGGGSKKSKKR